MIKSSASQIIIISHPSPAFHQISGQKGSLILHENESSLLGEKRELFSHSCLRGTNVYAPLHACRKRNAKVERVTIEKVKHSSIGQTPPVSQEISNFLLLCLIVSVVPRGPKTKSPPVAPHSSSPSPLHVCSHRVSCRVKVTSYPW